MTTAETLAESGQFSTKLVQDSKGSDLFSAVIKGPPNKMI